MNHFVQVNANLPGPIAGERAPDEKLAALKKDLGQRQRRRKDKKIMAGDS